MPPKPRRYAPSASWEAWALKRRMERAEGTPAERAQLAAAWRAAAQRAARVNPARAGPAGRKEV